MHVHLGALKKLIFGQPLSEVSHQRRGFLSHPLAQERLELAAMTVVHAYNLCLEYGFSESLRAHLSMITKDLCGFSHEGAAMGACVLDVISLYRHNYFRKFVEYYDNKHRYMSYIGAGLAFGALGLSPMSFMKKHPHFSQILVIDGIGFYHAFFKTKIYLGCAKAKIHRDFGSAKFRERYLAGMGRAIWFVAGANPENILQLVQKFEPEDQSSVWSGVGLASTYLCGVPEDKILELKRLAGKDHLIDLATGAVLASHARLKAQNPANYNKIPCEVYCNKSPTELHQLAQHQIEALKLHKSQPPEQANGWDQWLSQIRFHLLQSVPST